MNAQSTLPAPQPIIPRRSTGFPLLLIALGIVFLLANAGYVDSSIWTRLLSLWPLALVLFGIDLLLRGRSTALVAVLEIAVITVAIVAVITSSTAILPIGTNRTAVGRLDARSLSLVVNYGAGNLTLHGGATDLVQVASTRQDVTVRDVRHSGTAASVTIGPANEFSFGPDRSWDIAVPSDMGVALSTSLGAGDFELDLRDVQLSSATISNGASDLTLMLGRPHGDVPVTISSGASSLTISVDSGVAYRVRTTGGLISVDGLQQTASYDTAADRFTIVFSGGMSSVTIR
jgi:hypothetical protein